jgi:hypothetical protein
LTTAPKRRTIEVTLGLKRAQPRTSSRQRRSFPHAWSVCVPRLILNLTFPAVEVAMNASRFDRMTRRFAQRQVSRRADVPATASAVLADTTTRRQVLRGLLGGGIGALLGLRLGLIQPPGAAAQSTTAGIAEAINAYRQEHGLAPIPVSDELTRVAKAHVADLAAFHPEDACNGNLHSWSTNGNWTGGCYDSNNQATWPLMWDKPKEIAGYPGRGYEVSAWATPAITAEQALGIWQGSAPHNDVLLNGGIWANFPWGALGGWVADGYACAWFGQEPGTPPVVAPGPAGPDVASICPWGPNQCKQGFVWRVSTPDDLVCVTPEMRDQVAEDNALAEERKDPLCATQDCQFGADQCLQGYVWRVITPDDLVCVTPEMRDQVAEDNALAAERKDPACANAAGQTLAGVEETPASGAPPEPEAADTGPAPDAPSEEQTGTTEQVTPAEDTDTERPDSDNDGLYDDDETDVYFTDPDNPDTDGDGSDDGQEVFDGTDPNDPSGD